MSRDFSPEEIEDILSPECLHCSSELKFPVKLYISNLHELRTKMPAVERFWKKHEDCGYSEEFLKLIKSFDRA